MLQNLDWIKKANRCKEFHSKARVKSKNFELLVLVAAKMLQRWQSQWQQRLWQRQQQQQLWWQCRWPKPQPKIQVDVEVVQIFTLTLS